MNSDTNTKTTIIIKAELLRALRKKLAEGNTGAERSMSAHVSALIAADLSASHSSLPAPKTRVD